MNIQTTSWNHLESLLHQASAKKHSLTPQGTSYQNNPRLFRCIRQKKTPKGPHYVNFPGRSGNMTTKAKDKIGSVPTLMHVKSANDIARTYNTIQDPRQMYMQEDEDSSEFFEDGEKEASIDNFQRDNDENEEDVNNNYEYYEDGEEGFESRKLGSLDFNEVDQGTGYSGWPRKELLRQPSIENGLVLKSYVPVCGIDDNQIRELYRLKCQDLKIGMFADSEDSFVQGMKKKCTHSKLCLYESGFGPRALEKLGEIIHNNSQVTELCLRKSSLNGFAIRYFARSLAMMPCLIHLELANNAMEPQDFIILFEELAASNTIVSIDFSNYEPDKKNRFTLECLEAFTKFVQGNIFLQYIKMANLMLEDEVTRGILSASEGCPNLLILNLSSNNFTGKCLERLSFLLSGTSIIQLDLSGNKLQKEGATYFAKAIQGYKGYTREGLEFVLENTSLGADINLIFAAFGRDTNVAKLNFSNNLLNNVEMIRLESALGENVKLMELNMSNCKIGETGGKILALGLQRNKWIQSLVLSNNNIGDEVGSQIIHAVTHNPSLKALNMSHNKLASETSKALQDLIKKNPSIERYNFNMNKFDEKEGSILQEVLYFNSRITQFDLRHNPVKYNTIETVERIIKDNVAKLRFQAVPKLKKEVAKRKVFIEDEKHVVGDAREMERIKSDVKRDVEKFQKTLTTLKERSESPTIRRNEKQVVKLSKVIRAHNMEYKEALLKIREFTTQALLERETLKQAIEAALVGIRQAQRKVESKKRDIEQVQDKYEPEVKRLRSELAKLREENHFVEVYNETLLKKIRKEKKQAVIVSQMPNPKISDMFLATSELARHKKVNPGLDKTAQESKSRIGGLESQLHFSHDQENEKIAKEYDFAMKNQKFRINKLMAEKKDLKVKKNKKKLSKGENTEENSIKERVKEKIKGLIKDIQGTNDNILGQIIDN